MSNNKVDLADFKSRTRKSKKRQSNLEPDVTQTGKYMKYMVELNYAVQSTALKTKIKLPKTKNKTQENTTEGMSNEESEYTTVETETVDSEKDDIDLEMDAMRKRLMEMPFDELQKLKEKIGLKAYREAMFGTTMNPRKRVFKRENKNRPMEMSSKKPVSRHKQVYAVKKKVNRDPRFDDLSGEFNEELFKKSYSFLDDIKQREKLAILKKRDKESDPEKQEQMDYLIKRMNQQEQSARDKESKQIRQKERKKKEKELVQEGKQPFYLKKSDQKTLDLAEKYKELKKSGKLEKYLEKKRKKNASKQKRKLPNLQT